MVFNSIPFVIFLIVFFALWGFMNREDTRRWTFLVVMSFIFYGWWDWRFLFLVVGSGLIDYYAALAIVKWPNWRRTFFILSLAGNLGSLAFFKYYLFIATSLDYFFNWLGQETDFAKTAPGVTLAGVAGISFYTFQSMSYTIDVYRRRLEPTKNVLQFFSFLVLFPQLVAGPIVRAKDLLTQLAQRRMSDAHQKWNGIKLFAYGLFQKTVLADNIGVMVNRAYSPSNLEEGTLFWWLVVIGFGFQIYCDFSGYSLMARGIAKYMGYHLKINFNHPYLSDRFKEFWSRWHISLSTWFRDYVYIPMGGSKKGTAKALLFMSLTMIISGLWHGAWYTFLCWGALHAIYLATERILSVRKSPTDRFGLSKFGRILLVFLCVNLAWNFFRADTFGQAIEIYERLFSFRSGDAFFLLHFNALVFLILAIIIEVAYAFYLYSGKIRMTFFKKSYDVVFCSVALVMSLFFRGPAAEFIYFQF